MESLPRHFTDFLGKSIGCKRSRRDYDPAFGYLNGFFFVNGDAPDTAATPDWVLAEAYRIQPDMEMPDTVIVRGELPGGVPFWYGCSYAVAGETTRQFCYKFEKAELRCNYDRNDRVVRAHYENGTVVEYGSPDCTEECRCKFYTCLAKLTDDSVVLPCTLKTILPHLKLCNGLFDTVPDQVLDSSYLVDIPNGPEGTKLAKVLRDDLVMCYATGKLPSEIGFCWALPAKKFYPGEVTEFKGIYRKKP